MSKMSMSRMMVCISRICYITKYIVNPLLNTVHDPCIMGASQFQTRLNGADLIIADRGLLNIHVVGGLNYTGGRLTKFLPLKIV